MKKKIYKIGTRASHKKDEIIYHGTIIGFESWAVHFRNDDGSTCYLNAWDLL
jgi:hypothetical protein